MNKITRLSLYLWPLIGIATVNAAVVTPVGVTGFHRGDSDAPGSGSIATVIDGSGMTIGNADDPSTWMVSNTAWANDWQGFTADNSGNNTWIVFDLGSSTANLDSMYLWNVQENNALNRGTATFDIYHSISPTVAPPATTSTVTAYDFASGGWTAAGSGLTLAQGTQSGDFGEVFDVSAASGAQYIGLHLTSNHGGIRTGLAEAAFTTGAVIPEPGSMSLLLVGAMVAIRRRRR